MDFLFHNLTDKDKEDIKKQVDSILNEFSKKLSQIKEKVEESEIIREECERQEDETKKSNDFDREIMFKNAPESTEDFIIGEKKEMVEKIVASGPVIIQEGKLLVANDGKDNFYKIPGGKVKEGEDLEETCLRELEEETGFEGKIIKKLSTLILDKKPETNEKVIIELHHYQCELANPPKDYNSFNYNKHEVRWIKINELTTKKYALAPNIIYLIKQGDLQ